MLKALLAEAALTPEKLKYFFADENAEEALLSTIVGKRITGYVLDFMEDPQTNASKEFPFIAYETPFGWVGRGGRKLPLTIQSATDGTIKGLSERFSERGLQISHSYQEGMQCSAGSLPIRLHVSLHLASQAPK